jgi:hypothetical protein
MEGVGMRTNCKFYESRTYPSGESVRKCEAVVEAEAVVTVALLLGGSDTPGLSLLLLKAQPVKPRARRATEVTSRRAPVIRS